MKIHLLRYSQNKYQIWLHKLNLMCEELFFQIINISAVNQAVLLLLQVCKDHYRKENISVAGSEQRRDAFFEFI